MQSFISTPDYLIELLQQSDYSTIKSLCKSNKVINDFCRNNSIAKQIILERKQKFITNKIDYFLNNLKHYIKGLFDTDRFLYNQIHNLQPMDQALILASSIGDYDIVKELIQQGVDPSIMNNIALTQASKNGHFKVVDLLLNDPRVDPNRHNLGLSPFQWAVDKGFTDIVQRFLQDKRIYPTTDRDYAIRAASSKGYIDIVNLLLSLPKVPNKNVDPSADYNYAIRFASAHGHLPVVNRLLQDPRVDPSANDNFAIEWANKEGHKDVVHRLLQDSRVYKKLTPRQIDIYLLD